MNYQIDMDAETRALISHLSPHLKRLVKEALRGLSMDSMAGKPLQDELLGLRSYRLGRFRIVYQVNTSRHRIHVVVIGPRKTVYEDLTRDLKRRLNRA